MKPKYSVFAIIALTLEIAASCIFSSNGRLDSLSFNSIMTQSSHSDTTYVVIAGDLDTYSQIKSNKRSLFSEIKHNKPIKYVFCDFSMPENINAYRLFYPQKFPLLITIKQGKIVGISDNCQDLSDIHIDSSFEEKYCNLSSYHEKDSTLISLINRMYLIQNKLLLNDYSNAYNDIDFILAYLDNNNNIYIDCLLAILYDKIGNEKESTRIKNMIFNNEQFVNNPLFYSMANDNFRSDNATNIPSLIIDSLSVNLGQMKKDATKECQIGLHNVSTSNIIVYQVATSCSCIELSCAKIIPSQKTIFLKITFHATDSLGGFHKEIFITTNGFPSHTRIPIIGTISL